MNVIEDLQDQLKRINFRLDQLDKEIMEFHNEIECINQHNIFNSNILLSIKGEMKKYLNK